MLPVLGFRIPDVLLDELLDLGGVRPALEPRNGTLSLDEDKRRHLAHLEALGELRTLLDVDAGDRSLCRSFRAS